MEIHQLGKLIARLFRMIIIKIIVLIIIIMCALRGLFKVSNQIVNIVYNIKVVCYRMIADRLRVLKLKMSIQILNDRIGFMRRNKKVEVFKEMKYLRVQERVKIY